MRSKSAVFAGFFQPAVASSMLLSALAVTTGRSQAAAPYSPFVYERSSAARLAIERFRVPKGFVVELVAGEPLLANPVAFCIDRKGRFFVAETFRHSNGVTDNRRRMEWLEDDLASRTVADRIAMHRKYLGEKVGDWVREHDRVRRLDDSDGDGTIDRSIVFADGFHHLADGIGAGLLARNGNVWYTCIPDLWLLRDQDDDGRAEVRKSLQTGYGVHVAFIGHDLHGLRFGPDGKLYFSIGDRGLNVVNDGKTHAYPDTGAVLRCEPDGSGLEIFAFGLRNPQELAFDDHGNLFTGDNNSDSGDKARLVHLVEGSDSGWRIGYQYIETPVSRGPWNAERLWEPHWDGQAAYIVPPITNLADGPSGLTYYPGTGMPKRYENHFFLCDFRGAFGISGIRSFAVRPSGAGFEIADEHQFLWSVAATDVEFGKDGALYVLDWVDGWDPPRRGRIYRVFNPETASTPLVQEVEKLIEAGMQARSLDALAGLLGHADQRIRQAAQFELAGRGVLASTTLARVARESDNRLARLHAIWGLGQIGRRTSQALEPLAALLDDDDDAEVRAQAAKVAGDERYRAAYDRLLAMLDDPEPRPRFYAALALGKLGRPEAIGPLVRMLRANADQDVLLRHAGVMALTWIGAVDWLLKEADDRSPAVRRAVLLALRRLERPEITRFLNDSDTTLVLEAARAINDVPIEAALPKLATLPIDADLPVPLSLRILNANFRLGGAEQARAVARVAADADAPTEVRLEALDELLDWSEPSALDRVMGLWRPLEARPQSIATDAARPLLAAILRDAPDPVRARAATVAGSLGIRTVGAVLAQLVADPDRNTETRVAALDALDQIDDPRVRAALDIAVDGDDAILRSAARRLLAERDPEKAIPMLEDVLGSGTTGERQSALATFGSLETPKADRVIFLWLDKLAAGEVADELKLDVIEAAKARASAEIDRKLERYHATKPREDPLAPYRETLKGGDAVRGEKIFRNKAEVSCLRCHKIRGRGGDVGPELAGLGAKKPREYLLEAIVTPNAKIAEGFETVVLAFDDGTVATGVLQKETDERVRIVSPEGKIQWLDKARIDERGRGKSAMPEDAIKHLSNVELRDLIEFLATLEPTP